ncbi:Phox/Bem1p [Plasmopara halstedii]|uniref:Phox/Bem1p n=1 Tax=Plasmopara halstedii TaxID=4781 RepID=A0A0P1AR62_PLAHL|nr:Phox/Bem1p [Plasmopara halstedii]CEG43370.1 Phox/Bem1p [Plasmopara halstedii]|eukprot:XP_024579739.1 Phox/Bem1p [Plasmopara halstedii]
MAEQQVALKVAFNGDIHRTRVDLRKFSFKALNQLMMQTFRLPAGEFIVQYRDPEGDCVNVTTDADFNEALRVLSVSVGPLQSLKFSAITRHQVELSDQVTEPLIKSIEHIMQSLAVALERLKRDANFTPSVAPKTNVTPDQLPKDNAGSPKSAVGGFSSFAQGLVGQINRLIPEIKAGEAAAAPIASVESSTELEHKAVVLQPTEITPSPVPMVEASTAQEMEDMPSVASSVAFSEAEVKWAEQLSIVSGIFPNAKPAHIIDILEKSDGNLNVVLNVLTEEN